MPLNLPSDCELVRWVQVALECPDDVVSGELGSIVERDALANLEGPHLAACRTLPALGNAGSELALVVGEREVFADAAEDSGASQRLQW